MAATTSQQNEAVFYLDGSNFFPAVDAAIQAVIAAVPSPGTYVRMAFWGASHDMPLTDPYAAPVALNNILQSRLQQVACAGHPVDMILYRPGSTELAAEGLAGADMGTGLYETNETVQRFLNKWTSNIVKRIIPAPLQIIPAERIRVFLEKYDRNVPGASNHQKIVICSIAGQRMVFIGGFNLFSDYWDTPQHTDPNHTWHDTGVRLRGPATDAVEAEWARRWAKSGLPLVANTTVQNTYPPVGGQTVTVTIATTNSEGYFREADIQSQLTTLIAGANNYIYFENYAFTDPTLVDALSARIRAAAPAAPPDIFVNVSWPRPPAPNAPMTPYDFLDYIAWVKLALVTCASVDVPDPTGAGPAVNVARAGALTWRIRESSNVWSTLRSVTSTFSNRWMENDALEWQLPGQPVRSTRLIDIIAVNGGLQFYTATRSLGANALQPLYVHSKLALFDDQTAVVGTANFTYRSMVYDGEIVAIIQNPTLVTQIRQTLLPHYNSGGGAALSPATFIATAAANRASYTAGTLAGGYTRYILPLEMQDFSKVPPTGPANFTWY